MLSYLPSEKVEIAPANKLDELQRIIDNYGRHTISLSPLQQLHSDHPFFENECRMTIPLFSKLNQPFPKYEYS